MLKTIIQSLLFSLIVLSATAMADTYYKWKENGTWKYGAHPPAGVEAIAIQTSVGRASKAPTEKQGEDNTADGAGEENGELQGELFAESKPKISKEEKQKRCKAARNNLETLSSKAVIRLRGKDGEVRNLTVEEREAEKEKAKLVIDRYCA